MARPDLHELGGDDPPAAGAGAGPLPVIGAHGRDQVQGGLALEGEVAEDDALLVAVAVTAERPLVRGEEEEGGVRFGEQSLEADAELERLGVTQVGEHDPRGPLALGGGIERVVRGLDGEVGEPAGRGGELGERLLDRGIICHGGILAVPIGEAAPGSA